MQIHGILIDLIVSKINKINPDFYEEKGSE